LRGRRKFTKIKPGGGLRKMTPFYLETCRRQGKKSHGRLAIYKQPLDIPKEKDRNLWGRRKGESSQEETIKPYIKK